LNLIKFLQPRLKELVYKVDPELDLITNKDSQQQQLSEVLPVAWSQILVDTVGACLRSM